MKARTISKELRKKCDGWLKSLPEKLRKSVEKDVFITGGCIVSMLLKETVSDYDIYCRSVATAKALVEHYLEIFNSGPLGRRASVMYDIGGKAISIRVEDVTSEYLGEEGEAQQAEDAASQKGCPKYQPVYMSSNAITLTDGIQLVVRFMGPPGEIHENYDFVHCTCSWTAWDNRLTLPAAALESIITKELRYVGSRYPLCSVIRLRKFIDRGWTVNAGQILKMALQLQGFDLFNPAVLQDQLVGVDSAYFYQVLQAIKEKGDEKALDLAYLTEIIDRIF